MVRRFVSRLSSIAALLAIAGSAAAQSGTITGKVTQAEGGAPIPRANVTATSGLRSATVTTTDDGSYRITGLDAGTYNVVATRLGFAVKRADGISVPASGAATVNFAMADIATILNPISVTGTRGTPQKILDAPVSISVVSSERLATKPAATVAEILKTQPGLSVNTGGLVQSNIVSRGFNNAFSGQMLMLQDYRFAGVPSLRVNVPALFTGTNDDIERIEVLNGPASALYGPNSANGVLHIITKSPFDSKGTTMSVDGGGLSLFRGAIRHAGTVGSEWGYKISGDYLTGTDWPYKDPNEPAVYPSTAPAGRAGQPIVRDRLVRRWTGEARLDWRPGNSDMENIFTAGLTTFGSGIEITGAFGGAQAKNWQYQNFQDRFRYKRFFAQVFYNNNNSGNSGPSDLNGTYLLRTGIPIVDKSNVMVAQVQQGFDVLNLRMVAGADYIMTNPRSEGTIFGRNEGNTDIREHGAYVQTTVPLNPKLDLVTAIRGDQTDRLAGVQFSPRIALLYKRDATNSYRFSFSRAFNSPASFEYFLDQIANPTQAPGFVLRAIGNPPKQGWQFNRSCDATVNTGLCMHSPWVATGPTSAVSASAANAFPGFIQALPTIITGLPTLSAAQKAQLLGLLTQLNPILAPLRPTPAQVGTALNISGASIAASAVTDIVPLQPSFNNTWEIGYKGIIGNRLRIALDLWYQIRGDVGTPAGQANPLVLYDPATLGTYLVTNITAGLVASGLSQAQAQGTAAAAAAALVPLMAQLPQGTLAFTNTTLAPDQSIIATYRNRPGEIDVHGLDLAIDYQLNDEWMLAATYSNQDKIVFPEAGGATNPLMSNSPKYRATFSTRYTNDASGVALDGAIRYADAFPVNSGVYSSLKPNPGGGASYPAVPTQTQVDFGMSYRLPIQQRVTWSFNVSNLFDNRVPTFTGTPAIGRLMLTRLKYQF